MKTNLLRLFALLFTTALFAQSGHIMQGVGAVNMSMGGAATAQPLDISGAMQWNPAALSTFDDKIFKFDLGLFFSSPELFSTVPTPMGPFSGNTEDDRGISPLPALAMAWGKEGSKHTFGASAFGISGFGVTFPESMTNPINMPQSMGGFGHIESDYILLQVGLTYAYEITDKLSIGLQPNINYATLELAPNPLSAPDFPPIFGGTGKGYPTSDKASAIGFGGQVGLFFDSGFGLKLGASYKTAQVFNEFEFENTYLDGTEAPDVNFQMDYPAIFSLGFGYSLGDVDLALDFRRVDYENTEGFEASGWTMGSMGPTGSVDGFGWDNISILSAGLQYKGINKLPLRFGYTYSSNPINDDLVFFSIPATAIIKNAYQFGFSYEINDKWNVDLVYHYGDSGDKTEGSILTPIPAGFDVNGDGNPDGTWSPNNPLGVVPGSSVSYDMTTSMIQFGVSYTFNKKASDD